MQAGAAGGCGLVVGVDRTGHAEALAEAAERAIGTCGLALLAKRCKTIWLIATESDDDRVALLLAAILASAFLGPILSPGGQEIIGVRSARLKLEGRASPYR